MNSNDGLVIKLAETNGAKKTIKQISIGNAFLSIGNFRNRLNIKLLLLLKKKKKGIYGAYLFLNPPQIANTIPAMNIMLIRFKSAVPPVPNSVVLTPLTAVLIGSTRLTAIRIKIRTDTSILGSVEPLTLNIYRESKRGYKKPVYKTYYHIR